VVPTARCWERQSKKVSNPESAAAGRYTVLRGGTGTWGGGAWYSAQRVSLTQGSTAPWCGPPPLISTGTCGPAGGASSDVDFGGLPVLTSALQQKHLRTECPIYCTPNRTVVRPAVE
jgi:hypothetical protein